MKRPKTTQPLTERGITLEQVDRFNAAQHRAQRRIRLAIHALDHPGDELENDADAFTSAIAELLTDAADDLVIADETMQTAWKAQRGEP